jgi:cleavage and polyadenylation specificity factor subunit 1
MGQRLIHRTTFATGPNQPIQTLLLPKSPAGTSSSTNGLSSTANGVNGASADGTTQPYTLLLASPTGQLAALTPLSETSYRRLVSVTNQLVSALPHPAACNPKAFRMPNPNSRQPGVDATVGRGVVDGVVLARWNELGSRQRAEIASKGGYAIPQEVRAELDGILGWGTLGYL